MHQFIIPTHTSSGLQLYDPKKGCSFWRQPKPPISTVA